MNLKIKLNRFAESTPKNRQDIYMIRKDYPFDMISAEFNAHRQEAVDYEGEIYRMYQLVQDDMLWFTEEDVKFI